jgi:hypothetical protein
MGKYLPRRAFLKGIGVTVGLPFLDAMIPAFAAPAARVSPTRLAFIYAPTGIVMAHWTPATAGEDFEFTRILKPLEPYRQDLLVVSGLAHHNGEALGDGGGDHGRASASYLTGVHPKKTEGAELKCGVSVDQIAAAHIGKDSRLASLELGCEDGRQVGNCDSGYSCAYTNNVSWRSESQPLPPEVNPRAVFERLFGDADPDESPKARASRQADNRSVLDLVMEQSRGLCGKLGGTDRRKLDEYLSSVREIESRIQKTERESVRIPANLEKPAGVPLNYAEHARLLFDLLVVALQTDSTRVVTFMMAREGGMKPYPEIDVPEAHHSISHHQNKPELVEKCAKINCYHLEQFAYLVGKMKNTPEGDGSLLDHTALVYGSGLADSNRHEHFNLPTLIAGNAGGRIRTGRHLVFEKAKATPMSNLHLSLLDCVGVPADKVGDATGRLEHITDL